MNQKELILKYRTAGLLKGHRPCVILLKKNNGKIYMESAADFLMTIGKENLHFQRLSLFSKKLLPEKDFAVSLARLKSYNLRQVGMVMKCLTLYTVEKFYLEVFFYFNTRDSYVTNDNMASIIKMLEEKCVKELKS